MKLSDSERIKVGDSFVRPPKREAIKRGADLTRYVKRFLADHGIGGPEDAKDKDLSGILSLAGIPAFRWERPFDIEALSETYEDVSGPLNEIFMDALSFWYRIKNENLPWVNNQCGLIQHEGILHNYRYPTADKEVIRRASAWKAFLWSLVMEHWRTTNEYAKTVGGDEAAKITFPPKGAKYRWHKAYELYEAYLKECTRDLGATKMVRTFIKSKLAYLSHDEEEDLTGSLRRKHSDMWNASRS